MPEAEQSQIQIREHNQTTSTAATDAGMPATVVLQNPQTAAVGSGMPESTVLQPPTQPMEGVTEQSVPPEMSNLQDEPEHYGSDSTADSESDSSGPNPGSTRALTSAKSGRRSGDLQGKPCKPKRLIPLRLSVQRYLQPNHSSNLMCLGTGELISGTPAIRNRRSLKTSLLQKKC